ncbi:MAG: hypothetical protein K1X87_07680 [Dehalococcoidia bacterium]|nr:hypothetical protein [Dehalococcoidia bacterium]
MGLNLWLSSLIVVAAVAIAITLMLSIRRRAPAGGFFSDSDRAAGVFGVVGTAFSVLLAFVIFLAFETYTSADEQSAREADSVIDQFEIAELFAPADRDLVQSELVCYGRSVVRDEWGRMRDGDQSDVVEGWTIQLDQAVEAAQLSSARQETAFDKFFDETIEREAGRRGRLEEAHGVVPAPMWFILILGAGCVLGYILLFADSSERLVAQAALIGIVTALTVTSLLLVDFLDHPYRNKTGSIRPTSMERALATMDRGRHGDAGLCDQAGAPVAARSTSR